MLRAALLFLSLALPMQALAQAVPEDAKIAFMGIAYLNTSQEGEMYGDAPEELARIDMLEEMTVERFREEGYTFLDLAPVQERLDRIVNPAKCYGCDTRMGETLGADYVLMGEVQKVSNLILSMNLQLRRVPDGAVVAGRSADIRSNTDDSWARGLNYIMKNYMFRKDEG